MQGIKDLFQQITSMSPKLYLKKAAIDLKKTTEIWLNLFIIIIIEKAFCKLIYLALPAEKTSNSHDDFYNSNFSYQKDPVRNKKVRPGYLYLLSYIILKKYGKNRDYSIN